MVFTKVAKRKDVTNNKGKIKGDNVCAGRCLLYYCICDVELSLSHLFNLLNHFLECFLLLTVVDDTNSASDDTADGAPDKCAMGLEIVFEDKPDEPGDGETDAELQPFCVQLAEADHFQTRFAQIARQAFTGVEVAPDVLVEDGS